MHGNTGQLYNVAGGRKSKEDKLIQERPSGRNLKIMNVTYKNMAESVKTKEQVSMKR